MRICRFCALERFLNKMSILMRCYYGKEEYIFQPSGYYGIGNQ